MRVGKKKKKKKNYFFYIPCCCDLVELGRPLCGEHNKTLRPIRAKPVTGGTSSLKKGLYL